MTPGPLMKRFLASSIAAAFAVAMLPSHAATCESIQADIEAKLRQGGLKTFTVDIVEASSSAPGKVVGTCARGTRKLVYQASAAGARTAPVLTECRDGRVLVNGDCRK